jgi:ferredoxin
MRAEVDQEVCMGLGCCQQLCPRVFKVVERVAYVVVEDVPADDEDRCRDAMEECPTGAIFLRD